MMQTHAIKQNSKLVHAWRLLALCACGLILGTALSNAHAAAYPDKPVTILVAYAPGGQGDVFARVVGEKLGPLLGQSFIVDNRPGVSGTVGTRLATQAKKDGYTLLLGQTGELVVNRLLMPDLGYDPLKELTPIALIGDAPLVMLAPRDASYNTIAEFMQYARAHPGQSSYGSVGAGTPGHMSALALALGAGLDMVHIPYKGVGPLMTDLMAGRLQIFFSSASAALPQIKGGKLKALAVTTPQRMAALPNVPTLSESALPGFSYSLWGGLFAPAGTPAAVLDQLNQAVNQVLGQAEVKARFDADSVVVRRLTRQEFSDFVTRESQKFEKLVKDAKLKIEP